MQTKEAREGGTWSEAAWRGSSGNLGNIPMSVHATIRISLKKAESATKMRKNAPDAKCSVSRTGIDRCREAANAREIVAKTSPGLRRIEP
jgi:hypothetical protein